MSARDAGRNGPPADPDTRRSAKADGRRTGRTRGSASTCRTYNACAALERSRSGNGGHVWTFFAEPVSAILARRLGAFFLTTTMERRPEIRLESYDPFFPNQGALPSGGFGNLIALPLQRTAREQGNSVFFDERLQPYCDQMAFLAPLQPMSSDGVERIVETAQRSGRIVGVRRRGCVRVYHQVPAPCGADHLTNMATMAPARLRSVPRTSTHPEPDVEGAVAGRPAVVRLCAIRRTSRKLSAPSSKSVG